MSEEKIKFVVLAPQRSGSNLLVSYLDYVNPIRCRYDIMCHRSQEANEEYIKEFGITNFIESCYHHNFDANMKFKDEIENPNLANGFKLAYKDLINEEQMLLDEGIKFNNFLKDWSKKSKQPIEKVNKSMNNKNTFAIAKLNDFSVDKVFDSAKSGFKTFQKVMN